MKNDANNAHAILEIERLTKTAVLASQHVLLTPIPEDLPENIVFYQGDGGLLRYVEVPKRPANVFEFFSLDSFCQWIVARGGRGGGAGSAVFISREGGGDFLVKYLPNAYSNREHAQFRAAASGAWKFAVGGGGVLSQDALIRLLRFEAAGIFSVDLLAAVRKVTFRSRSESTANLEATRESLGRQVEAEAIGADKIPETFDWTMQVFDNVAGPEFVATVPYGVQVLQSQSSFRVSPLPGTILTKELEAGGSLRTKVLLATKQTEVQVYLGSSDTIRR